MSDVLRNYAVYAWVAGTRRWILRQRYSRPQEAIAYPIQPQFRAVVIDLVSGRMIYDRGAWRDSKRPVGIKTLPPFDRYQGESKPSVE